MLFAVNRNGIIIRRIFPEYRRIIGRIISFSFALILGITLNLNCCYRELCDVRGHAVDRADSVDSRQNMPPCHAVEESDSEAAENDGRHCDGCPTDSSAISTSDISQLTSLESGPKYIDNILFGRHNNILIGAEGSYTPRRYFLKTHDPGLRVYLLHQVFLN